MPRVNTKSGLTPKEEVFVAEYLIDGNGKRAAIAAGYAPRRAADQAYEMVRKPHIAAALKAAKDKRAKKLALTAEKVLTDIARVAQKAEDSEEYSAALKGHELLGKHLKMFTEKHEVTGKDGAPLTAAAMTDDDLALIAAGKKPKP